MTETLGALTAWREASAEAALRAADALAEALVGLDAVEPLVTARYGLNNSRTAELRNVKATIRDAIRESRDEAEAVGGFTL